MKREIGQTFASFCETADCKFSRLKYDSISGINFDLSSYEDIIDQLEKVIFSLCCLPYQNFFQDDLLLLLEHYCKNREMDKFL